MHKKKQTNKWDAVAYATCSPIVPEVCCRWTDLESSNCLQIFAMHWVQFVLRFFRGWRWKHTQISLVWLASGGAKHPSSFHSVFCRWRSWPRLTVVGHGVCGGQKHRLWLWLWSLLSGRALSQALALFGSPGDRRVNYKNLFLCRHAEAGEQGWDGEALVGILERNP